MKELIELLEISKSDFHQNFEENTNKASKVLKELSGNILSEFKKLPDYIDQFYFWEEELEINYFKYHLEYEHSRYANYAYLHEYELNTQEENWGSLNEWYLIEIPKYISKRLKRINNSQKDLQFKEILESTFISFEQLKESFDNEVFDCANSLELIQNELIKLDEWYTSKSIGINIDNAKYFQQYLELKKAPDYSKIFPSVKNVLAVNNFFQYARYKEYLQLQFNKQTVNGFNESPQEKLSHSQTAIALDYSGIIYACYSCGIDKIIIAKTIAAITGSGVKGIYDAILKVDDKKKSADDMQVVLKRFKEKELKPQAQKISSEMPLKTS